MNSILVNGIKLYAAHDSAELISEAFSSKKILVAVNAEKILMANDEFSSFISNNLGYPDGIGAVWLLRRKGYPYVRRIPGVELWLEIIKARYLTKSFYLIGGKEKVICETVRSLESDFPGFRLLGYRNGYIKTNEEREALKSDILLKKPDVIFVAMGSPIQEQLMRELHEIHPAVYQGLGGSFDVYTGRVERAPRWWRENNLEWAYRLYKEPWRIKRQIHLVKFIPYILFNKK